MQNRKFVYVDGESHFHRSEDAWRSIHGADACLTDLSYSDAVDPQLVLVIPKAKVFWTRRMNPGADRVVYFTTVFGDDQYVHDCCLQLRTFHVEPQIIKEEKQLAKQRQNLLEQDRVIEKPKGVDVALSVRMFEDVSHLAFDECHLYTSDIDFLPLIRAVRARGKKVIVHGYRNGLSKQSELLTVPDWFVDIEASLRSDCNNICNGES